VSKYGKTSNLRPLGLGEEKIERKKYGKKPQGKNIMSASATQGGHKKAQIHGGPWTLDVLVKFNKLPVIPDNRELSSMPYCIPFRLSVIGRRQVA